MSRLSREASHSGILRRCPCRGERAPAKDLRAQQKRFDSYLHEYNVDRPHASLERRTPAQLYERSSRIYPEKLPALIYPDIAEVRLVDSGGSFKWLSKNRFLSKNLAGQYIGLIENAADLVTISYGALELGLLDPQLNQLAPRLRWNGE